jgi:hypothetical protein
MHENIIIRRYTYPYYFYFCAHLSYIDMHVIPVRSQYIFYSSHVDVTIVVLFLGFF